MSKSIERVSVTLPNGAGAAVDSNAISNNAGVYQGDVRCVKVVTPNFTNNITVTVAIYDANGVEKWISGNIAKNSGAKGACLYPTVDGVLVRVPLEKGEYFKVTPSGDPGGTGGTVTIDMEYKPDVFMKL